MFIESSTTSGRAPFGGAEKFLDVCLSTSAPLLRTAPEGLGGLRAINVSPLRGANLLPGGKPEPHDFGSSTLAASMTCAKKRWSCDTECQRFKRPFFG